MAQQVTTLLPAGIPVRINNRHRISADTNALQFHMPPLTDIPVNISSYLCYVYHALFRNYIPNIRNGVNNIFTCVINTVTHTLVLTEGPYTMDQLIDTLNTFIQAINIGFVFSYDDDSKCIQLLVPIGFNFRIPQLHLNGVPSEQTVEERFLETIGFLPRTNITYTGATSIIGIAVNALGSSFLSVNLQSINLGVVNSDPRNPQTIIQIPLTENFGGLIDYAPAHVMTFQVQPDALQQLTIGCTDEWGLPVYGPSAALLVVDLLLVALD